MMQKTNVVHYQKMYILKNLVVFDLGHLTENETVIHISINDT
jgi:hypothetical protein